MQQARDGQGQALADVDRQEPAGYYQAPCTERSIEVNTAAIGSPVSVLVSARRDPFDSFAMSLGPVEHFLFDHCKYISLIHATVVINRGVLTNLLQM